VKTLLKSVNIYGSYRKIKTGVSLFWTTLYSHIHIHSTKHQTVRKQTENKISSSSSISGLVNK